MRTIRTKIYTFAELSETAKKQAIKDYLNTDREFIDGYDGLESIKKALVFYGFELGNYQIDWSHASGSHTPIKTDHSDDIENLSGVRLFKYLQNNYSTYHCKYQKKQRPTLEGNCPFTGYYVDESFCDSIREFMSKPDNTTFTELMDKAVFSCLKTLQNDYEYQQGDEYATEEINNNEWEFMVNGKKWNL